MCHSKNKESKENAIFQRRVKSFEVGINKINEGLNKKRTIKKYENIIERIGRLKEKYHVGNFFYY